ncbi:patatin-like phospholipase family protein [Daejeonella oryzae]|uniref:patatin-like phospholipase family protein n=1 Tax=Daejeonella oryzae TaxID=1122943 RepID=UPI0003F4D8D6|nr:patatin-like phospholipase family protein [Daejeonella oryzae]
MKIGIVLSGGGIRGIAHLGVLKVLTEAGLRFEKISGTSAGSIVGALFAQGHDPYEILEVFLKIRLVKYLRPALGTSGLLTLENTRKLFLEYLPHNSFEKLNIPLVITATNFSVSKLTYFSQGELIPAILASSTIPGIFKPIHIDSHLYVDGGVMNNFPVEPLLNDCNFIIGSSCNKLRDINQVGGLKKYLSRAATISINADIEEKSKLCDVMIEPEGLGEITIFEISRAEEIYWRAYEATLKAIQTNEKLNTLIANFKMKNIINDKA